MDITKKMEGTNLLVALTGRLDTITSGELASSLEGESGYKDVIFDFSALDYLSSSGLRLLFTLNRKLGGKEHVIVKNANEVVKEIFRVTGFEKQITLE